MDSNFPTVAIVGRPNVGKSSLFNAILKRRLAIVHHESGVTRDRIAASTHWEGRHFQIIDTGGLGVLKGAKKNLGIWDTEIKEQVEIAIDSAELLIFVTDVADGVTALDMDIAGRLRQSGKKVVVVVNKADNPGLEEDAANFAKLGFDVVLSVSCVHRRGITAILDKIIEKIDWETAVPPVEPALRIAVIGRPNVGKSSIINRLLGEKRVMVSDIPGTTRDSIDIGFELKCKDETIHAALIDTAGLRQKKKADTAVEIFSIIRSEEAVKRAQVVLFVIEATTETGVTAQDKRIADMISKSGKACIILANKWDLCRKAQNPEEVFKEIRYALTFMDYAPVIFTSAADGHNFQKIPAMLSEVMENMRMKIPTSLLNRIVGDAVKKNSPTSVGTHNHYFKIYYATMIGNEPPEFVFFVNDPKICTANYVSYLNNCLRKSLGLTGLPIRIKFRPREKVIKPKRNY